MHIEWCDGERVCGVYCRMSDATHVRVGRDWMAIGRSIVPRLDPIVVLAALVTVPLTVAEVNGQEGDAFRVADWTVWAVFVADYLLGLAVSTNRRKYLIHAWLGLAVVIASFPLLPSLLAFARLARLARLFRLVRLVAFAARALPALRSSLGRRGLLYVLALLVLLIVFAGAMMSVAEPQTVHGNMWDGMWWAIVTATTVGYGDISPVSPIGRLIAVVLMMFGIGLTATLAASVAAHFVSSDQGSDVREVVNRLDRVERLLEELKAREQER
jgi:voltage-gated potassium channel